MKKNTIDAGELAKIIRGKRIRDIGSGLEGYGSAVTTFLYGCTFIIFSYDKGTIGRTVKNTLPEEAEFLDGDVDIDFAETEITFADEEILGKKCRDRVSGFEGVAEQLLCRANTATQVVLQPQATEGNSKLPDRESFDYGRLEVIGDGIVPEKVQQPERSTGGVVSRDMIPNRSMIL